MKRKRRILLFALAVALVGVCGWLALLPREPLFHGKPESEWITNIVYGMSLSDSQNQEQIQRWRDFGSEGLRVLERGLEANRGRTYRKVYRLLSPRLPSVFVRLLPAPPMDSTRGTRMNVLDLLSRMGTNAQPAWPTVARALADEDPGARQIAITFFTHPENDTALLNQMPAAQKQKLVPLFIRALEDRGQNWGLRNNAALALKYCPEQASVVAPALVKALQDPAPQVRLLAAEALNRVDPHAARKAGAVNVLIQLLRHPDDQVASRAAFALREFKHESEAVVPALVEALHSTNNIVACNAVWSLEWAFSPHADRIVPDLRKAAERKDNVGGYARSALKHLEANPAPK